MHHSIAIDTREYRDSWDLELTTDSGHLTGRIDSFPFIIHIKNALYEMNQCGEIHRLSSVIYPNHPGEAVGSTWRGRMHGGCDHRSGVYNSSVVCMDIRSVRVRGYTVTVAGGYLVFNRLLPIIHENDTPILVKPRASRCQSCVLM